MSNTTQPNTQMKMNVTMPVPIEGLLCTLNNIQSKIDAAAGAATALELRLRIIAQWEPKVRVALQNHTKVRYHQAPLRDLIEAVLEVFQGLLDSAEQDKIRSCRPPRNKAAHGSFAELVIELSGEASGREIDPHTFKRKPLAEDDIIEGAICIERNRGLEDFTQRAKEAVVILERKVLRSLKP